MTPADRLRFSAALLILLLWGGLLLEFYGTDEALNTATPVAFAAATFLFATPLFEARREKKRTRNGEPENGQ
jgi:hypothetical protein